MRRVHISFLSHRITIQKSEDFDQEILKKSHKLAAKDAYSDGMDAPPVSPRVGGGGGGGGPEDPSGSSIDVLQLLTTGHGSQVRTVIFFQHVWEISVVLPFSEIVSWCGY